jgi:hypothetical protein
MLLLRKKPAVCKSCNLIISRDFASSVQKGYWLEKSNQREFLDTVATKLQVKNFTDWYNISIQVCLRHYPLDLQLEH